MTQDVFWMLSASAAWIGFVVAVVSLFVAIFSYRRALHEERAKLYLELRRRYLEARKVLPPRYFNAPASEINETDKDWYDAELYWYQAFDEWFSTNKLNRGAHKELWDLFFGPAIQSTLRHSAMRNVVWHMMQGRVSFGTFRDEFRDVLDDLWRKLSKDNHNLSDGLKK